MIKIFELKPSTELTDKILAGNGITDVTSKELAAGNPGAANVLIQCQILNPNNYKLFIGCLKAMDIQGEKLYLAYKQQFNKNASSMMNFVLGG